MDQSNLNRFAPLADSLDRDEPHEEHSKKEIVPHASFIKKSIQPKLRVQTKKSKAPPTQVEEDICVEICRVILMMYEYFGFDANLYSIARSIRIHQKLSIGMPFMKYWKYRFAAFFSFWKNQEQPKCPIPDANFIGPMDNHVGKLLYGRGDRFVCHLLRHSDSGKWGPFLQTMLLLKKGLRRPTGYDVCLGLKDTFDMLTNHNPLTSSVTENDLYLNKKFKLNEEGRIVEDVRGNITLGRLFRKKIREIVKQVYGKPNEKELSELTFGYNPRMPSTNANYVFTNNMAGTLGLLLHTFHECLTKLDRRDQGVNDIEQLVKAFQNRWGSSIKAVISHVTVEKLNEEEDSMDNFPLRSIELPIQMVTDIETICEEFSIVLRRFAINEDSMVGLVGLKEALKVRVISKGPPFTYYALKPMQKYLHKYLRRHQAFEFIGHPDNAEDIKKIFGTLGENQYFVSGDYKDATNNMHPLLGKLVVNAICDELTLDNLEPSFRPLMHKALTGHIVRNPIKEAVDRSQSYTGKNKERIKEIESELESFYKIVAPRKVLPSEEYQRFSQISYRKFLEESLLELISGKEELPQLNGQLMGSPMSFIVLCIVNCAVISSVDELITGRNRSIDRLGATFNGDDFVYKTTKRGYSCWRSLTSFTGMEESVGKTFISKDFLNINSREYTYSNGSYTSVPFVNLGLIMGYKRSQNSDNIDEIDNSISSRASELLKCCPEDLRPKVYDFFLNYNKEEISRCKLPWFIPEQFGGLGLPILLKNNHLYDYHQFGLPSTLTELLRSGSVTPTIEQFDNDPSTFKWSDFFHTFGRTITYPTYRNLAGLRNLVTYRKEGYLIDKIKSVNDPVIYTIESAIKKHLPSAILVDTRQAAHLREIPQLTPKLQLVYLLYKLIDPRPIFIDETFVGLEEELKDRIKICRRAIEHNNIPYFKKEFSELRILFEIEDYSPFKSEDPSMIRENVLMFSMMIGDLYRFNARLQNESVWAEISSLANFKKPFNTFYPASLRIPFEYSL